MAFLHSKFYFDIRTDAENHILTFKNPILTLELGMNIAF